MAQNLTQLYGAGNISSGFGSLTTVRGNTPVGYFDNDTEFVRDAKNCTVFVSQRLGITSGVGAGLFLNLSDIGVYAAFEEAVLTYGNMVYQYKIRDNYINLEGSETDVFNQTSTTLMNSVTGKTPIFWSGPRLARCDEINYNTSYSQSIVDGEVYVISSSLSNYVSPNIDFLNNFTFAGDAPYSAQGGPTYTATNLSRVVLNQFNIFSGPTSSSLDTNNNTVHTILDGASYIYFFIVDSGVSGANPSCFQNYSANGIPTVYYQERLPNELNNKVLNNNLAAQIRIADTYGGEASVGGTIREYSGSLHLKPGKQDYDLNAWAIASASLKDGDSIEVRQVFYQEPPAIVRYFDPYAGTGTGVQGLLETFGFGSYSPGINFMLMPVYWDIQKIQAIEFNDQVRKSAFSFDLVDNQLRIFPVPGDMYEGHKLWFRYVKKMDKNKPTVDTVRTVVSDVMRVPYRNPIYSNINHVGRMWIYRYTLALCKEIEGTTKTIMDSGQIPGMLKGAELLTDARSEKTNLMEELKEMLTEVSRRAQLERKQQEADFTRQTMNQVPLLIYAL
jgi:hypothetical protein